MMSDPRALRLRVIVAGDAGCGKSAFVRFARGTRRDSSGTPMPTSRVQPPPTGVGMRLSVAPFSDVLAAAGITGGNSDDVFHRHAGDASADLCGGYVEFIELDGARTHARECLAGLVDALAQPGECPCLLVIVARSDKGSHSLATSSVLSDWGRRVRAVAHAHRREASGTSSTIGDDAGGSRMRHAGSGRVRLMLNRTKATVAVWLVTWLDWIAAAQRDPARLYGPGESLLHWFAVATGGGEQGTRRGANAPQGVVLGVRTDSRFTNSPRRQPTLHVAVGLSEASDEGEHDRSLPHPSRFEDSMMHDASGHEDSALPLPAGGTVTAEGFGTRHLGRGAGAGAAGLQARLAAYGRAALATALCFLWGPHWWALVRLCVRSLQLALSVALFGPGQVVVPWVEEAAGTAAACAAVAELCQARRADTTQLSSQGSFPAFVGETGASLTDLNFIGVLRFPPGDRGRGASKMAAASNVYGWHQFLLQLSGGKCGPSVQFSSTTSG